VQLRDHPLMRYRGEPNWPPVWVRLGRAKAETAKRLRGEIGVLKEARYYSDRHGKLYLTVEHNGAVYVGCLLFDLQWFCTAVFEHLRHCYGLAICDIGSSHMA
jgi:hypothetical protein